ncbi:MAG TPA: AraC family ligand binding domain-containing protein [Tepidisphaeraceae bacterium]|nr:AraC family ligand binding domain-containing protein [Tepidisphaeraceae bacterium]
MADQNSDRLRQHPKERFAAPQHQFDLDAAIAALRHELRSGQAGHRQQTLYKHGPTSISLFLFGHLTRLPPHRARGVVSIHVLKGHLRVMAEGQSHDLHGGSLLVLAPDIEHDLVAHEESEVLLTVHLESGSDSPPGRT